MPLAARDFAAGLLAEARETHPWLHHPLFRMIAGGELPRERVRHVIREQGCFFLDTLRHAAWKIISVGGYTPTWGGSSSARDPLVVEEGGHHDRRQTRPTPILRAPVRGLAGRATTCSTRRTAQ
jgi:hypothetical protein